MIKFYVCTFFDTLQLSVVFFKIEGSAMAKRRAFFKILDTSLLARVVNLPGCEETFNDTRVGAVFWLLFFARFPSIMKKLYKIRDTQIGLKLSKI